MTQMVGKYQLEKNENLDEYFKAIGKYPSALAFIIYFMVFELLTGFSFVNSV
jgi:hypothetical protein